MLWCWFYCWNDGWLGFGCWLIALLLWFIVGVFVFGGLCLLCLVDVCLAVFNLRWWLCWVVGLWLLVSSSWYLLVI